MVTKYGFFSEAEYILQGTAGTSNAAHVDVSAASFRPASGGRLGKVSLRPARNMHLQ
jgi:hypothetical protein